MHDAELGQGAPDLGEPVLVHLAAGLWRVEAMAGPVGIDRAGKPVRPDDLTLDTH